MQKNWNGTYGDKWYELYLPVKDIPDIYSGYEEIVIDGLTLGRISELVSPDYWLPKTIISNKRCFYTFVEKYGLIVKSRAWKKYREFHQGIFSGNYTLYMSDGVPVLALPKDYILHMSKRILNKVEFALYSISDRVNGDDIV